MSSADPMTLWGLLRRNRYQLERGTTSGCKAVIIAGQNRALGQLTTSAFRANLLLHFEKRSQQVPRTPVNHVCIGEHEALSCRFGMDEGSG